MALRLRHPGGVSSIQIPLDNDQFTVNDLQQKIYSATNILPSRQSLKTGYPPQTLTLIPELPFSSLGLKANEQIIVSENPNASMAPANAPPTRTPVQPPTNSSTVPVPRPAPSSTRPVPTSPPASKQSGPEHVDTENGALIHRVVPDDNSCLFSAVALIFEQDIVHAPKLRQIVAEGIRKDPSTYNEAVLGMDPQKYISTITKPTTWGGAIELGILASHYNTEIASVDVETGRIDHFSPQVNANGMRCLVIYSGIHYDAATIAPMVDAPSEWHQTVFPISGSEESDGILLAAKKLANQLREKKAFTNTATFDLKCEQCGQGLKGEKAARAHAEQTGHVKFGEY